MNDIFQEPDGKTSSKRVAGIIVVVISLGLAIVDTFTKYTVNETIWLTMFGGGMTMLMRKPRFKHEINPRGDDEEKL